MDWMDLKLKKSFVIITGDGEVYTPIWKATGTQDDLSAVAMQFNDIASAFVKRSFYGLSTYDLEIYFQGANHLETFKKFRESARNPRNWTIDHPYYGRVICQPTKLKYNHKSDNVTEVTGVLWETIEREEVDPLKLQKIQAALDAILNGVAQMNVTADDLGYIEANTDKVGRFSLRAAVTAIDGESINKAINKTNSALNTIGTKPQFFMAQLEKVIRAPGTFYATAKNRLENIRNSFDSLTAAVKSLSRLPQKIYTEAAAGISVLATADALTFSNGEIRTIQEEEVGVDGTNPKPPIAEDIKTRTDVLNFAIRMKQINDDYTARMGDMQTPHDNRLDSYHPNPEIARLVRELSDETAAYLYEISLSADQERSYIVPEDMSVLVLSGIIGVPVEEVVETNNLNTEERILLPKGKEILYTI